MKKKTISSLTLFSLILWAFLGLAISPARSHPVPGEAQLIIRDIENPLLVPGTTFRADILVADLGENVLQAFEFSITWDPDVLFGIDIGAYPPYYPTEKDIGWGYMRIKAQALLPGDRATGDPPRAIAWIGFYVFKRGQTSVDIVDSVLYDEWGWPIPHHTHDGVFDNRLEGIIRAPIIKNENLVPGTTFMATIEVDAPPPEHKPIDIWGVQFRLEWDPNVLMAIPLLYPQNGFTWFPISPMWGPGWLEAAVAHPPGSLGTTVPPKLPVVSLEFAVLAYGTTAFHFSEVPCEDPKLVDASGTPLFNEVEDGWFANTQDIAVALDTGFVESRRFKLSKDPEGLQTLTAQIKNMEAGWTQVQMYFLVYDELGGLFDIVTTNGSIAPEQTMRLSADIDVKDCAGEAFSVEVFGDYFKEGAWVRMNKGATSAAKDKKVMSFTVQA